MVVTQTLDKASKQEWYSRLESLYISGKAQKSDKRYCSAALALWVTAATEELLTTASEVALSAMTQQELSDIVAEMSIFPIDRLAANLNTKFLALA